MLTSSLAPGAAAVKYWKVLLEASTRPDTRPPSVCSHSSRARSGSIEMLHRPCWSFVSTPVSCLETPNSSGSLVWSPTSTTIVRNPRWTARRPRAAATVVLPTPPLPVTTSSLRSSMDRIVVGSLSETGIDRLVPTIGRMSAPSGDPIDLEVKYDGQGLAPCVVQDWNTGEVLTLAYMNEEALQRTRETGELHLWSRSREQP